eukprot:756889-Hanusia_phi.AAC.3
MYWKDGRPAGASLARKDGAGEASLPVPPTRINKGKQAKKEPKAALSMKKEQGATQQKSLWPTWRDWMLINAIRNHNVTCHVPVSPRLTILPGCGSFSSGSSKEGGRGGTGACRHGERVQAAKQRHQLQVRPARFLDLG